MRKTEKDKWGEKDGEYWSGRMSHTVKEEKGNKKENKTSADGRREY